MYDLGTLLLLVAGAAAGGAGLCWWLISIQVRRNVRVLELDLGELESRLIREVKRRAGEARWEVHEEPGGTEPDPAELLAEVKRGFLSPAEFARQKSKRRMIRGIKSPEGDQRSG